IRVGISFGIRGQPLDPPCAGCDAPFASNPRGTATCISDSRWNSKSDRRPPNPVPPHRSHYRRSSCRFPHRLWVREESIRSGGCQLMDQGKLGDGATPGTWVMGTPVAPHANPANWQGVPVDHVTSSSAGPSAGHYPTNTNHAMPPVPGASHFPSSTHGGTGTGTGNPYVNISPFPHGSNASGNPYVTVAPVPTKSGWKYLIGGPSETILKVLGRCGKKLEDTTRKAGDVAGNVWHHRKLFFAHYILVSCINDNLCMVQISNKCYLRLANHQRDQMHLFTCICIEKL
ncbi:hypothetical protein BHE74_00047395, partial [Ensete ventricosum]